MKGVSFRKLHKVCSRSSDTCEVTLDNACVPAGNFLGGDTSFGDTIGLFDIERIYLSARALGLSQAAYEAALNYAKERKAFGQPIANFQAIKFKIANMAILLNAERLLAYHSAWLYDQGRPFVKEASMAKIFTAEAAGIICYDAVHIHGGYGLMLDLPVQRYWRDIGTTTIGGGTSKMQHVRIAGKLGLQGGKMNDR